MKLPRIPYWFFLLGPALLFALGFASNALVMAANGGQMPVLIPGGCDLEIREALASEREREGIAVHSCMTRETHLKILGDWIVIRHLGMASPGDFGEWAFDVTFWPGLVLWAFAMISRERDARI